MVRLKNKSFLLPQRSPRMQRLKERELTSAYSKSLVIKLFFVITFLTACMPATPQPLPTPQIWQAQFTPSLRWIGPALNLCTRQQPGIALSIDERPAQALTPAQADFILRWGAPDTLKGYAVEIATDELVVIVHPDNPLDSLDLSEITAIFTAKTKSWSAFIKGNSGRIQVWTEADGSDVQQVFQSILLQQPLTNPFAHLAPDPMAMRQSVGADLNAIGYLPRRWLDSTVRAVQIKGISAASLRQPILVMRETGPQGAQKDWLLCLQESIK
jgi:DNA-binding transcriptional LysR family regulator